MPTLVAGRLQQGHPTPGGPPADHPGRRRRERRDLAHDRPERADADRRRRPRRRRASAAYQAELAAIKTAQAALTDAQRQYIEYWSGGGVLRWNQILRELVARVNLPPAPRDDGTYPAPDAENPFADPQFPFANPPYAARAYSYVSVAQFEALEGGLVLQVPLQPAVALPGRRRDPGADADERSPGLPVGGRGAVRRDRRAAEAAVPDVRRGDHAEGGGAAGRGAPVRQGHGRATSRPDSPWARRWRRCSSARAAADGMRTAGGTPALWQAIADAAAARGEIPWKSLESPPRPPMLPNFGQVQAWMMTPTDIVNERPPAPPSTSSDADAAGAGRGQADRREPDAGRSSPSSTSGPMARARTRLRATGTTSRRSTCATPT